MARKRIRTFLLAAAAALGFCRALDADLRIDLRVTSVIGPATLNDSQSVLVFDTPTTINMDIWARVTGTNANLLDEGLVSLSGSMLSGRTAASDGVRGTMFATLAPSLRALGSFHGSQHDLDGDIDLDVGSNNNSDPTGFFAGRVIGAPHAMLGSEICVGTAAFRVEELTSKDGEARLFFRPREIGTAATWVEDGHTSTPTVPGTAYLTGASVKVVAIPEPGAMGFFSTVVVFAAVLRPQRRKHDSYAT